MYFLKKKQAFMSLITKVKGFLRTATGTSSLTLNDCVDKASLVSLSVSGNSSQSGTPTPTNPVEVAAVGDNPNLCDINSALLTNATLSDGVITSTSTSPSVDILLPAGTYGLYIKRQSTSTIYLRNGRVTSGNLVGQMTSDFITFTYNASTDGYLRLSWFTKGSSISNIMLVKGTYTAETMPVYIPYGKYGIPISCEGNIFDRSKCNPNFISENAVAMNFGTAMMGSVETKINLKLGAKYTIAADIECVSLSELAESTPYNNSFGILLYDSTNRVTLPSTYNQTISVGDTVKYAKTFTVPNNFYDNSWSLLAYCNNYHCSDGTNRSPRFKIKNIQILRGDYTVSTLPDYTKYSQPYDAVITLNKPLYKIGDYADELIIDYDNHTAKRINRTGSFKIGGNNVHFTYTSATFYGNNESASLRGLCRILFYRFYTTNFAYGPILCKELKGYSKLSQDAYTISSVAQYNSCYVYFKLTDIGEETPATTFNVSDSATKNKMIDFIKDFTIYFPLSTETREDVTSQIDWSQIPNTATGTTVITATSATLPSAMEATYYSTTDPESEV